MDPSPTREPVPRPEAATDCGDDASPSRARFRPHERIKEPAAFRRAFDRRRSVSDALLVIYGVENGLDHSRLGISVSRKKVRKASARNRHKRLIREAFRLGKSGIPPGMDLVVIPRPGEPDFAAVQASFSKLARDLSRRLKLPRPRADGEAAP